MNIEAAIRRYLVDEVLLGRPLEINSGESLIQAGILDSVALLKFISFVEDEFKLTIDDAEVLPDHFESIDATKEFVERKLTGRS